MYTHPNPSFSQYKVEFEGFLLHELVNVLSDTKIFDWVISLADVSIQAELSERRSDSSQQNIQ